MTVRIPVPGASAVPVFGELFRYRNDASSKTELVIFLRPIVVKDASLEGDYKHLKSLQPGDDFFTKPDTPRMPRAWTRDGAAGSQADAGARRASNEPVDEGPETGRETSPAGDCGGAGAVGR